MTSISAPPMIEWVPLNGKFLLSQQYYLPWLFNNLTQVMPAEEILDSLGMAIRVEACKMFHRM